MINTKASQQQQQHQNKLFNSLLTFIWETRKGEHRFPDQGYDPYPLTKWRTDKAR